MVQARDLSEVEALQRSLKEHQDKYTNTMLECPANNQNADYREHMDRLDNLQSAIAEMSSALESMTGVFPTTEFLDSL